VQVRGLIAGGRSGLLDHPLAVRWRTRPYRPLVAVTNRTLSTPETGALGIRPTTAGSPCGPVAPPGGGLAWQADAQRWCQRLVCLPAGVRRGWSLRGLRELTARWSVCRENVRPPPPWTPRRC